MLQPKLIVSSIHTYNTYDIRFVFVDVFFLPNSSATPTGYPTIDFGSHTVYLEDNIKSHKHTHTLDAIHKSRLLYRLLTAYKSEVPTPPPQFN